MFLDLTVSPCLIVTSVGFWHRTQMRALLPFAAASLLLTSLYLLSTCVTPKLTEPPFPPANLPSSSLTDLHDEMLKGSIKLELQITKQPETSWRIPARVHFIWIGPKLIKDKYVKNNNNFCEHNPDYEVWKSERFTLVAGDTLAGEK